MKLLLDTHIWIWSLLTPHNLTRLVSSSLRRSQRETWISPVSSWEILTLSQKGRFSAAPSPGAWIEAALDSGQFHEAPFTQAVALALDEIWLPHRDPADWFLAATARTYGLTLVTADANIRKGRGFQVLFNE